MLKTISLKFMAFVHLVGKVDSKKGSAFFTIGRNLAA
jgi:hypothetical protein